MRVGTDGKKFRIKPLDHGFDPLCRRCDSFGRRSRKSPLSAHRAQGRALALVGDWCRTPPKLFCIKKKLYSG